MRPPAPFQVRGPAPSVQPDCHLPNPAAQASQLVVVTNMIFRHALNGSTRASGGR